MMSVYERASDMESKRAEAADGLESGGKGEGRYLGSGGGIAAFGAAGVKAFGSLLGGRGCCIRRPSEIWSELGSPSGWLSKAPATKPGGCLIGTVS